MTAPKPMTRAELAEKVAKLANLNVENGATEHEAAAAAAAMQALLQRYNMSIADLSAEMQAKENPMATEVVAFERRNKKTNRPKRGASWKRKLAYNLGPVTFTQVLTSSGSATFLGAKTDVENAAYIFHFLVGVLSPLASEYTKKTTDAFIDELGIEDKNHLPGEKHPTVVRNSFLDGAVSTVTKSMQKQAAEFVDSSKKASALVPMKAAAAKEYALGEYKRRGMKLKGWRAGDNQKNWDAYADGKEAGEKIKVTKGLKEPKAPKAKTIAAPAAA